MKRILTLLLLTLTLFTPSFDAFCQTAAKIITELPLKEWSGEYKKEQLTKEKKQLFLDEHPRDSNFLFIMDSYDEESDEATSYWPHTYDDFYFLDLDFDGDLDMLFSGINGNMKQQSTKIYYNNGKELIYNQTLPNGILDIKKEETYFRVFTLFKPCCDSYTNRIDEYHLSKDTLYLKESVSFIGRTHSLLKGVPKYTLAKTQTIKNPSILVLPTDFNGISAYFRDRNKEIREKLKNKEVIEFLKIEGDVKIQIISEINFHGIEYSLIITQPLNNLPKMPISLYEWSSHKGSRIVGWIKSADL